MSLRALAVFGLLVVPVEAGELRQAPPEPRSAERECRTDTDCGLVPDDCTHCPPCEATWRKAATVATIKRLLARRPECPPISCEQCAPTPGPYGPLPRGYLGDTAACRRGQCVVLSH